MTANVATDSKTSGGGIQDAESTWKNPGFASTDVHPVMNVRRGDVQKFCTELSRWDEQTYRLPTEAEWEYSGMTGTSTLWANGDNPEVTAQIGNVAHGTLKTRFRHFSQFCINVDDGYIITAPVHLFPANGFGLFDLYGNVFDCSADVYDAHPDDHRSHPAIDPQPSAGSDFRVLRGGSWFIRSTVHPLQQSIQFLAQEPLWQFPGCSYREDSITSSSRIVFAVPRDWDFELFCRPTSFLQGGLQPVLQGSARHDSGLLVIRTEDAVAT